MSAGQIRLTVDRLVLRGIRTLGIAGWHLIPASIVRNIAAVVGATRLSDADDLVRKVTLTKSAAERLEGGDR